MTRRTLKWSGSRFFRSPPPSSNGLCQCVLYLRTWMTVSVYRRFFFVCLLCVLTRRIPELHGVKKNRSQKGFPIEIARVCVACERAGENHRSYSPSHCYTWECKHGDACEAFGKVYFGCLINDHTFKQNIIYRDMQITFSWTIWTFKKSRVSKKPMFINVMNHEINNCIVCLLSSKRYNLVSSSCFVSGCSVLRREATEVCDITLFD